MDFVVRPIMACYKHQHRDRCNVMCCVYKDMYDTVICKGCFAFHTAPPFFPDNPRVKVVNRTLATHTPSAWPQAGGRLQSAPNSVPHLDPTHVESASPSRGRFHGEIRRETCQSYRSPSSSWCATFVSTGSSTQPAAQPAGGAPRQTWPFAECCRARCPRWPPGISTHSMAKSSAAGPWDGAAGGGGSGGPSEELPASARPGRWGGGHCVSSHCVTCVGTCQ